MRCWCIVCPTIGYKSLEKLKKPYLQFFQGSRETEIVSSCRASSGPSHQCAFISLCLKKTKTERGFHQPLSPLHVVPRWGYELTCTFEGLYILNYLYIVRLVVSFCCFTIFSGHWMKPPTITTYSTCNVQKTEEQAIIIVVITPQPQNPQDIGTQQIAPALWSDSRFVL